MSEADARRKTWMGFGGLDQVKEACRDVRSTRALTDLGDDVRFALRVLAKDRWFTAGAVLALALAMGLASTAFTMVNAMVFRDIPVHRPDRIAFLSTVDGRGRPGGVSYSDFEDWRRGATAFEALAAYARGTISLGRDGAVPEQFNGLYVSTRTFSVLGVAPALGRDFSPEDDRQGAAPVVIIGNAIWKRRYGGSPDIVGRTISVNNGAPATIIAVMPEGFRFDYWADVWLPLSQMPGVTLQRREARSLSVIGRLVGDIPVTAAAAELAATAAALALQYPETNREVRPKVEALRERVNGKASDPIFLTLQLAAACVLLIACANLANLLLARAAHRSREMAIRTALGATRWRIVRQLLVESLLLAVAAALVAVGFSLFAVRQFAPQLQEVQPYWVHLTVDARVFGFIAALALATAGLFGLAPALYAARPQVSHGLKDGGRSSGGVGTRRWTNALLVGEFALTLSALTAAGLMARSFYTFYVLDAGVHTSDGVTLFVRLPLEKYATAAQRLAFHQQLRDQLTAVPGITGSAIATALPFAPTARRRLVSLDGVPVGDPAPDITTVAVGPGYFDTLGVALALGEPFANEHGTAGHEAAIVNRRFAELYLGDGNPLGRRLQLQLDARSAASVPVAIIGVSPNIRQNQGDAVPVVYLPFRAEAPAGATLIVRGVGGPARVVAIARRVTQAMDPDLALGTVRTLDEMRDLSRLPWTLMASLFTTFGLVALVLSAVGLYSVMAYAVTQRTQEIGIRMALGAQSRDVGWLLLKGSAGVVAGGLLVGLPAAFGVGQVLQDNLVRTGAHDPVTLAAIVLLLLAVALAASVVPTRRATRLNPTMALRLE
jgi:predicted permease